MRKVTIHKSEKEALLKIRQVFRRKTRPSDTPVHYGKIHLKRED